MSAAVDALLAELAPPPVPNGLAERVSAAARATPQEAHAGRARRAGRDRRGRWRRGLAIGVGAFGLAVSGAVAATLAGVPLPAKVEAVIAKLPLVGKEAPAPAWLAQRRRAPPPAKALRAVAESSPAAPAAAPDPFKAQRVKRLAAVRRAVAARRAAGLPTPRADRIERRIQHALRRWEQATPEERQLFLERRQRRIERRRAWLDARRERFEVRRRADPGGPDFLPPAADLPPPR